MKSDSGGKDQEVGEVTIKTVEEKHYALLGLVPTRITILVFPIFLVLISMNSFAAQKVTCLEGHFGRLAGLYSGGGHDYDPNRGLIVGMSWGVVRGNHWLTSVGLDVTSNIYQSNYGYDTQLLLSVQQSVFLNKVPRSSWNPYFGVQASGGVITYVVPGLPSYDRELVYSASLNFGVDFRIVGPSSGNYLVLSSANNLCFFAPSPGIRQLHIGVGLKVFMGPDESDFNN